MSVVSLRGPAKVLSGGEEAESLVVASSTGGGSMSGGNAETLTINPIATQVVGVAFIVSGTYSPVD